MKKLSIGLIIVGCLAAAVAFVLPVIAAQVRAAQNAAAVGIIGGASGPTYWFLFSETKARYLLDAGLILAAVGGVLRWKSRKL